MLEPHDDLVAPASHRPREPVAIVLLEHHAHEVVDAVGFDSEIFDDFHLYDVDFTFQAYRKGFQLAVCRDLALIHSSRGKPNDRWQHYRERFEAKYRGQLSEGTPGTMQTVGVTVAREKLALLCDPEYLLRAIRWS